MFVAFTPPSRPLAAHLPSKGRHEWKEGLYDRKNRGFRGEFRH